MLYELCRVVFKFREEQIRMLMIIDLSIEYLQQKVHCGCVKERVVIPMER
jgi:hypothetical protein